MHPYKWCLCKDTRENSTTYQENRVPIRHASCPISRQLRVFINYKDLIPLFSFANIVILALHSEFLLSSPVKLGGYDVTGSSPRLFLQNIPKGNFCPVKNKQRKKVEFNIISVKLGCGECFNSPVAWNKVIKLTQRFINWCIYNFILNHFSWKYWSQDNELIFPCGMYHDLLL